MRDHSHIWTEGSDVCAHCGQPLRAADPHPSYGRKRTSPTGLIVTALLHLLLVAIYLFQPKTERHVAGPSGAEIVYLLPTPGKPKPQEQAPKKKSRPTPHKTAPEVAHVQRLPNTITLPDEKPVEVTKTEPKKEAPPPEADMQAYIEARRKQRGAQAPSTQTEETDEARGMRNALANISAANNRGRDDRNESGGVFEVTGKSFSSATVKFRGWNPNFKRRWLTQVTVELGGNPDIETAIVMKMIELIRKEKTGDFEWESHRLNRVVTMSARTEDTEQLKAFLFKEMFEDYKPPRR